MRETPDPTPHVRHPSVATLLLSRVGDHAPTPAPDSPAEPVPFHETLRVIGCPPDAVRRLIADGRLVGELRDGAESFSLTQVEMLATELYPWRLHRRDPHSYWVTQLGAAMILGVSRGRIDQLTRTWRLPHVRHQDGTRLYRRHELTALARAGNRHPRSTGD